jgi:hypothetical protein
MNYIVGISLIIVFICTVLLLVFRKTKFENILNVLLALMIVTIIFGLLVLPMAVPYKRESIEISDYKLIRGNDYVALFYFDDNDDSRLVMYDSYKTSKSINDSTKFFILKSKSYYGFIITKQILWSNYPYTKMNKRYEK